MENDLRKIAKVWIIHSPGDRKIKRVLREAAGYVRDIRLYSNVCARKKR